MPGQYVLTELSYFRLQGFGFRLTCFKCGKPIEVGDEVVSKAREKRLYHKECWEKLFI
jgi:hypothetical protein